MNYDIGIIYREDMPEQLVLDLAQELREANVNVETEKRPNEPLAVLEIPAAIIIFFASQYVGGLLSEAAKDHYPIIKTKLSQFARKVSGIKQKIVVSSQSPDKVREDNPISNSFAIWSKTIDGRTVKFLFLGDRDEDYYETCTNEIFSVLLNHAQEYPNDYISNQADRLPRKSRDIHMLFDETAKKWKAVDIATGLLANSSDAI